MIKNILVMLALVAGFLGFYGSSNAQNMAIIPSEYDKGYSIEDFKGNNKPTVLIFYTDWCGACKRVVPIFDAIRSDLKDNVNFVMVNADKDTTMSDKYGIEYYPTVFFIDEKGKRTEIKKEKYFYDTFKNKIENLMD
ncbi:MAG: TlpA family protein disulfide reductase [Vampirovibrionia bacterium]